MLGTTINIPNSKIQNSSDMGKLRLEQLLLRSRKFSPCPLAERKSGIPESDQMNSQDELMDLGELAATLMPPKIKELSKNESHCKKRIYRRHSSSANSDSGISNRSIQTEQNEKLIRTLSEPFILPSP